MLSLLLFVVVGVTAGGQAPGRASNQAPSIEQAQQLSQDLMRTLQPIRVLVAPPPVSQVIRSARVTGGTALMPLTAILGFADVSVYQMQLKSIFPVSQTAYPSDSLRAVQQGRAAEWVRRLSAVPAVEQGSAVNGWERVPFAEVAARAANDSLARHLFDTRIAELVSKPVEQSYALFEVVATLADPTQDSVRLVRNLALAERYLTTLQAARTTGYKTQHDSTTVLYHQWKAEDTLLVGYDMVGDTARVLAHARHLLSYALVVGVHERGIVGHVYDRVFHALWQTPAGRTQLAAFNAPVLAMARRAATEIPANTMAADRERLQGLAPTLQGRMNELAAWLALLGTPAPSVTAHLWLNTPDSVYALPPRTLTFTDGRVHILAFGHFTDFNQLAVLSRAQAHFASGVRALYVTHTGGSAGPDILGPADEARWLTQYLRGVQQYTVPIAIWAGSKHQVGFVPEGHYPVFRPEETPNETPFQRNMLGLRCVLIDKHGIIRFFQDIDTRHDQDLTRRRDEAQLWRRVQQLLDEPTTTRTTSAARTISMADDDQATKVHHVTL